MMMLNQHGDGKKPLVAMPGRLAESGRPAPTARRSSGRALALGAPLSASFMGLLLMRGEAEAAGETVAEPADASPRPSGDTASAGAAGGTGAAPLALVAAGPGMPVAATATPAGMEGAVDTAALTRLGETAPAGRHTSSPEAEALPVAAGAVAESAPPVPPAIGGVTVAFGSEAPFELPTYATEEPDLPEENLGDLGDPRLIERTPIIGGDEAEGSSATAGGNAAGTLTGQRITGTSGNDYLVGTDGSDVIDVGGGNNTVLAGAGDDHVLGGPGNDVLRGGAGNDTIEGRAGRNIIYGDEGDDLLIGGAGKDKLYGGSGNDRLDGGTGGDWLEGGTGDDTLVINDPHDVVLETGQGRDGGGNDTLEVAAGFGAALRGRFPSLAPDGTATFVMGDLPDRTFPAEVDAYRHQVNPHIENVHLVGSDAHDVMGDDRANVITGNDGDNHLYGEGGDDILYAGGGDDALHGGAGNDTLHAGAGHNVLFGDEGDDLLHAGFGESELHGGEGDDLYAFGLAEDGRATIFDHEGVNRLRFDGLEDPADLDARLEGEDLVFDHGGTEVVRIADYVGRPEAFAGIETASGTVPLETFLGRAVAEGPAASTEGDLLDIYLGPQSVDAPDDILDPAHLDEPPPAHDAAFALYEDEGGQDFDAGPPAHAVGGTDDMILSFMHSEPLWIGPEEGVLMPDGDDLRGVPGEEAQQHRA